MDMLLIVLAIVFFAYCIAGGIYDYMETQKLEQSEKHERDIKQAIRIANIK